MKRRKLLFILAVIMIPAFAFTKYYTEKAAAAEEVKKVVKESYIHGAFNELNPEAMAKGFHEDFAIFSAKGEAIGKYPIKTWVESVKTSKAKPDFDPEKNKWDHNFATVDVTGGSAMVKVELSKDGKHIFTDYLSLLKFDSGWRIVAKVYHKH
ncbi:MAG: nuclear transport factor 2 family protein [Bacteroidota bacterium]